MAAGQKNKDLYRVLGVASDASRSGPVEAIPGATVAASPAAPIGPDAAAPEAPALLRVKNRTAMVRPPT